MRAPGMNIDENANVHMDCFNHELHCCFRFPCIDNCTCYWERWIGYLVPNFFTMTNGGMDMLWANLFWVWGHPEVYILILPAFGIYSEIISTFSRRNLYGYKSMVASIVHHFIFLILGLDSPFLYNGARSIDK